MKWEFKHPSIKRVGLLHSEDVFNLQIKKTLPWDDSDGKESAWNAGDLGSILGLGRSTGEGNSNPLQYASLEIPMDRGAWHATVHGVTKSQTQLSDCTFTFSCAIDRELDWKLQSPAPIFGKHDFPSKMFLSFISVSAQWLPLPVTPSACTCLSVFIHCDTIYACGHILALVYSLPKKIIIIVTEFKSFKSISVISWYCGKPCTSFFWSFLLLLLLGFWFFFFPFSYLLYHTQGQGRCPCLESLFCVLKPLEMGFCSVSLGRSCLSLCFLLHRFWLRSRST